MQYGRRGMARGLFRVVLACAIACGSCGPHSPPIRSAPPPRPPPLARLIAEDAPLPVAALPAAALAPPPATDDRLIDGPMEQVLYGDPRHAAGEALVGQALDLFAHRMDLTRDLVLGDRIRLLVRRPPGGAPVLDYAEWRGSAGGARFYRRRDAVRFAVGDFTDETGADVDRLLLRTPLDRRRITSGFGLRLHPLLGYTRLHQGVDFAAAAGSPVLAAGDGVVRTAGWAGGYGRLIALGHAGGYETRYAHLSAFGPGVHPGAAVRQGQVIGWSGASGLATGPHLHFEVRLAGRPIDPRGVQLPAPPDPARQAAFQARRAAIDARLS